jgi:long-chain fatty acid transport protein
MSAVLTGVPVLPLTPGSNPATNASVRLKGNSYGYGWNSGILLQITDALKFGVSYISRITHEITDGEQEVALSDGTVIKQDARSSIVLPAIGKAGIALTVKPWVVELDAEWIEWSAYDRSRVRFADGTSIDTPKNWHDAWTWHLGTQYTVNQYIDLRAGVAYGQTPVPRSTLDPLVVGGNRIAYFLGLGSHLGKVTIDLGYIYTRDTGSTWDNSTGNVNVGNTAITQVKGRFVDTYCHTIAVGFGYRF